MAGKNIVSNIIIAAQDKFSKVFGKLRKSVKGGIDVAKDFGKKFAIGAGVAVAAVGGVTAAVGVMIQRVFDAQDELGKTADRLGLTTEALQGIHQAGELAGVGFSTMDMALQRMTRRLAEAKNGSGEAKGAIEELGLNAEQLANGGPEAALQTIIEKLEGVENEADRVRLAFKFFDSEGVKLLNLTSEGLAEAAEEARALGTALDRKTIASMEQVNDNVDKIKQGFSGFAAQLSAKVAPVLEVITGKLVAFAKQGGLADLGAKLGDGIAKALPKLLEFVRVAGVAFVQTIPRALVFMLDLIGKVALAFNGWTLIVNGLKQLFIALGILMGEVFQVPLDMLAKIMQGLAATGKVSQQTADGFKGLAELNDKALMGLDTKLQKAVAEQSKLVAEQDVHQRKIAKYQTDIDDMQESFDGFASSLSKAFTTAADESAAAIQKVKKEVEELNSMSISPGGGFSDPEVAALSEKLRKEQRTG